MLGTGNLRIIVEVLLPASTASIIAGLRVSAGLGWQSLIGAELIVAVGTHATLVEFLDKGRQGMASTFLTRLRVGSKLVDAKGVSLLYRSRISSLSLLWLALAGLSALVAALLASPGGRAFFGVLAVRWDDVWAWIEGLF